MKLELKSTCEETGSTVDMQADVLTWYAALDFFVKFLRANGFKLQDNSVGINEAAGHIIPEDEWLMNITTFNEGK